MQLGTIRCRRRDVRVVPSARGEKDAREQDWPFLRRIDVPIVGAIFWFLLGSVTTVAVGVNAIRAIIDDITAQFCEALPLVCDLVGTGM